MFVYVFTRPDNLVIAEGGDTVESGFYDLDALANYVVKALNQLAQQADHGAGKGIVLTQDASTKAVTFAVKDWEDIAFLSKLSEAGRGPECKLLDGVSLKTNGITNGNYFVMNCSDSPNKNDSYFCTTMSYSRHIWQQLSNIENGERWYRYCKDGGTWSAWTPLNNVPIRDMGGNIWLEEGAESDG